MLTDWISRALTAAGYPESTHAQGLRTAGHQCRWNPDRRQVTVLHMCRDHTPDTHWAPAQSRMLDAYAEALTAAGYTVEHNYYHCLYVSPAKKETT